MKLLQSIILVGVVFALSISTFAMDDDGDLNKTDPFYRAASGKMHMAEPKHSEAMDHNKSGGKMAKMSERRHLHSVFSPKHPFTPLYDNR